MAVVCISSEAGEQLTLRLLLYVSGGGAATGGVALLGHRLQRRSSSLSPLLVLLLPLLPLAVSVPALERTYGALLLEQLPLGQPAASENEPEQRRRPAHEGLECGVAIELVVNQACHVLGIVCQHIWHQHLRHHRQRQVRFW
jgi:hypothetical protein